MHFRNACKNRTQLLHILNTCNHFNEISSINNNNNYYYLSITNTKYLEIIIENSLTLREHIFQIMHKLGKAAYIMRVNKPTDSLKSVYYSYFHSFIIYTITF
jgi:hypothetical protein